KSQSLIKSRFEATPLAVVSTCLRLVDYLIPLRKKNEQEYYENCLSLLDQTLGLVKGQHKDLAELQLKKAEFDSDFGCFLLKDPDKLDQGCKFCIQAIQV